MLLVILNPLKGLASYSCVTGLESSELNVYLELY